MDNVLKKYIKTFLKAFQSTLSNPILLAQAKEALGSGARCQLNGIFKGHQWSEEDTHHASAAYFEAIAQANVLNAEKNQGDQLTHQCQSYINHEVVPRLFQPGERYPTPHELNARIRTALQEVTLSPFEKHPYLFFSATVTTIAVVSAITGACVKLNQ